MYVIIVTQLRNIPVEMGSSVCHASICGPYLIVMSEQGAVMLLQLKISEDGEARLTVLKQPSDTVSIILIDRMMYTPTFTGVHINMVICIYIHALFHQIYRK